MHCISLVPVLLALAPAAVSALAPLGFALGTKNPDGSCKYTADYEADFDTLKSQSTIVRGYAADDCNFAQQVLPAAKNKGFQVLLGIWSVSSAPLVVLPLRNPLPRSLLEAEHLQLICWC